jgi:hypothetical protein
MITPIKVMMIHIILSVISSVVAAKAKPKSTKIAPMIYRRSKKSIYMKRCNFFIGLHLAFLELIP